MSYRIYLKKDDGTSFQAFGNNVVPKPVIDYLKKDGCIINAPDYIFDDYEIKDLDKLIKATEKYILEEDKIINSLEDKKINSIADFSQEYKRAKTYGDLTFSMKEIMDCGIIFTSVNILNFIGEENYKIDFTEKGFKYVLKENCKLYIYGD